MADVPLAERVEKLEKTLESLADIPRRMTAVENRVGSLESQIVQLRTNMKDEFSAARVEARREARRTARRIRWSERNLLEVIASSSRATESLFKETQSQMRVLHEDLVERIGRIGD